MSAPLLGQGAAPTKPVKAPATPARPAIPLPAAAGVAWTQWGGPRRNFQTEASGIKDVWPAGGPRVVWTRPLGEGYSAPVVENGVLYTMLRTVPRRGRDRRQRRDGADAVGAGLTAVVRQRGGRRDGQRPLRVAADCRRSVVHGRRRRPLPVLRQAHGQAPVDAGPLGHAQGLAAGLLRRLASSPIAFRDLAIVPVGGPGKSVMAFRQADGAVAWGRLDYGNAYSSPILINVSGLEQLAVLMDGALIAVNPHNGDQQWEVPFKALYAIAVATPVYGPDNLLFVSSEIRRRRQGDRAAAPGAADEGHRAVEQQPLPPPPRQRDAHRRGDHIPAAARAASRSCRPSRRAPARRSGRSAASARRRSCGPTRS